MRKNVKRTFLQYEKENLSKLKSHLYTCIRIQQLKLMQIHADPDPNLSKKERKLVKEKEEM
jgi:hypothetical protein